MYNINNNYNLETMDNIPEEAAEEAFEEAAEEAPE